MNYDGKFLFIHFEIYNQIDFSKSERGKWLDPFESMSELEDERMEEWMREVKK